MSEYETCERCERDVPPEDLEEITLTESHEVCYGCVTALTEDIEFYDWKDRYTEEQHERAVSLLAEQDEIECVINDYDGGQIVVHTEYVSSDVITDFCNHFGFNIVAFGPQWEQGGQWPCVRQHGSLFEVMLEYNHRSEMPVPMNIKFNRNHLDRLDENDKQFGDE